MYQAKTIHELADHYYNEFKGLPSNYPIVRNDQPNDAYEIAVLDILYGSYFEHSFDKEMLDAIGQYVICPPDSGIDIFFMRESGDDVSFDVIQVKNAELTETELNDAIIKMERTIDNFCRDPENVQSKSCREVLSNSRLELSNKNNCTYYVVHMGDLNGFAGAKDNERVLNKTDLEFILNNEVDGVKEDTIHLSESMPYSTSDGANEAVVCTLSGYDLAKLNNRYYSTEAGRNILFGSNFRESLSTKKSKTFNSMKNTIEKEPEKFWFFNNGITIIAEDYSIDSTNKMITLKGFSIVNGAQTTSALGQVLKEAQTKHNDDLISNIQSVEVLARILRISDEAMRENIAIYNNTQNTITSRDMVANRPEQKRLNSWLLDEHYPQIYMEIRRGASIPATINKKQKHRQTTNEELAQIVYAYFLQDPFTAKDKKSALFNNDFTNDEVIINEIYHRIFNFDENNPEKNGEVFKLTKKEIDEALFARQLYKDSLTKLRATYQKRRKQFQAEIDAATSNEAKSRAEERLARNQLMLNTIGICMFPFLTLYNELSHRFGSEKAGSYNYEKYYSDKQYKDELAQAVADLILAMTANLLIETAQAEGASSNMNNWVRGKNGNTKFKEAMDSKLTSDLAIEDRYNQFEEKYKTSQ